MAAAEKALAARQADHPGQARPQRARQGGGEEPHRRDRRATTRCSTRSAAATASSRCPSLDDLIENCLAFGQGRLPKGPRSRCPATRAAPRAWSLDYASDEGAAMAPLTPETRAKLQAMIDPGLAAENPLDVGPTVGVQAPQFAEICKVVCADPTVDLVTVQGLMPVNPGDPVRSGAAARRVRRRPTSRCWRSAASRRTSPRSAANTRPRPACRSSTACPRPSARCATSSRYAAALRRGAGAIAEPRGRAAQPEGARVRCAARGAWPDAAARARSPRRRTRPPRKPAADRLSGGGEDRLAAGEPQDRGRRRRAASRDAAGGARGRRSHGARLRAHDPRARDRRLPGAGDGRRASRCWSACARIRSSARSWRSASAASRSRR